MTAFVAGATGYVGQEVVRQLVARGIRTIAHVRPDSPEIITWKDRFREMGAEPDATAWDEVPLAEQLGDYAPRLVFCLIGTTRKRGRQAKRHGAAAETYETVDYGLTALLARAAARARGERRFVYLSSIGVGPHAAGAYLQARWKAEEAVRAAGLPWTIVRPSIITGPDRAEKRPLETIAGVAADGLLDLVGRFGGTALRDRYHSIDARGLAEVLIRLGLDPAACNHVYEPPYRTPVA